VYADYDVVAGDVREAMEGVAGRVKGTVRAIVDEEVESAEDFPDAGRAFGRRVNDLDSTVTALEARLDRLGDVGAEAGTKEPKFAAILKFARNK